MSTATEKLRISLHDQFGFRRFRPGQIEAIKAVLDGRDNQRVIRRERVGSYRLMRSKLDRSQLIQIGQVYQERRERDLERGQRMADYGETQACRWQPILDYFGDLPVGFSECSVCDSCRREADR